MSLSVSENKSSRKPPIPKITVEIINAEIAKVLEFINNHPEITQTQLEKLDRKIKLLHEKKTSTYLVESKSEQKSPYRKTKTPKKSMRKSVTFSQDTKHGGAKQGGKTRRRRVRRL